MSNKYKWIAAAVLVLGIVVIAQASAVEKRYFPLVYQQPTITPTPTATPKPTDCLVQYFHEQKLKICFSDIDPKPTSSPLDESIDIKNIGGGTVDMTGWRIVSDSSSIKYHFPDGFEIKVGQTVEVFTKTGSDGASQLYMNQLPAFWIPPEYHGFWKNNGDCGYLKDADRKTINSFCYGTTGFTAAPVNK